MFTLTIETDGAAFQEEDCGSYGDTREEIARILHVLGAQLALTNHDSGDVRDIYGNTCGSWKLS